MDESIEIDPVPPNESTPLLRHQVLVSQAYALGMARWAALDPEEAARRFFEGVTGGGEGEPVAAENMAQVVVPVARYQQLIHGYAQLGRQGDAWTVEAPLVADLHAALDRWAVPLDYYIRWLGEMQRLEGERMGVEWRTWLQDGSIHQELQART